MHGHEAKAKAFRALHLPGRPLILFNVWDAGSAKTVAKAGASAIATSSWAVAAAQGLEDGEKLPLADLISNLVRIARATDLPVTSDIERGYGERASELGQTVKRTIDAGAVGCNIEDSQRTGKLRERDAQAERISWVRKAADAARLSYFINARTDVFFQGPPATHDHSMVDEALGRAGAYARAGADGLFVPGLIDIDLIRVLVERSPIPVNVMIAEGSPGLDQLARAGVARISHGPGPYLQAMAALASAAAELVERPTAQLVPS
jgi:2-methylisocitrate lyase-like PEP mutase family enzyme